MTDSADMMRRYMMLCEALPMDVHVTVGAYIGISDDLMGLPPFPSVLRLTVDGSLTRDAATKAIEAEIQAATGYDPRRFTWRPVRDDDADESQAPSRRS
jgi:hypothetical protein